VTVQWNQWIIIYRPLLLQDSVDMISFDLKHETLEKGKLEKHPVIKLLGGLFAFRKSGELAIKGANKTITIFVFNGIPINAKATGAGASLLELMAKDKMLSSEDMLQIKQLAREKGIDEEECLQMLHEVPESRLYYYKALAAKQTMVGAAGIKTGEFFFTDSEEFFDNMEMFDLNPLEIIYEGMVGFHLTDLFQEIYDLEEKKVSLNKELKEFFLLPGPLYEISHMLDFFEQDIKIKKAVNILQSEIRDINLSLYGLYLLLVTGILTITGDEAKNKGRQTPSEQQAKIKEEKVENEEDEKVSHHPMHRQDKQQQQIRENKPARGPQENASTTPPEDISTDYIITRPRKERVGATANKKTEEAKTRQVSHEREPSRVTDVERPFAGSAAKASGAEDESGHLKNKREDTESRTEQIRQMIDSEKERMNMALNLYDLLGVSVEEEAEGILESFTDRKRKFEEINLPEDAPEELLEDLQEAAACLEEAYYKLVDPEKRFEYESELAETEMERAYKLPMKVALARKMDMRGNWYMSHNCPRYAKEFFLKALNLNTEEAQYYMNLGWAIFRAREDIREAKDYIYSALQIDPELTRACYYMGVIAKQENNYEEAEEMFRKALEADPEESSAKRELAFLSQKKKQSGIWQKLFSSK